MLALVWVALAGMLVWTLQVPLCYPDLALTYVTKVSTSSPLVLAA